MSSESNNDQLAGSEQGQSQPRNPENQHRAFVWQMNTNMAEAESVTRENDANLSSSAPTVIYLLSATGAEKGEGGGQYRVSCPKKKKKKSIPAPLKHPFAKP